MWFQTRNVQCLSSITKRCILIVVLICLMLVIQQTEIILRASFCSTFTLRTTMDTGYARFSCNQKRTKEWCHCCNSQYVCDEKSELMRAAIPYSAKWMQWIYWRAKYIYTTRILYTKLTGPFFYTFAKYNDSPVLWEVIYNPTQLTVDAAMLEMMKRYVLVAPDPSEKFLQALFISLMVSDDTFTESRIRAKTLDSINYCLKLPASEYMAVNSSVRKISCWYGLGQYIMSLSTIGVSITSSTWQHQLSRREWLRIFERLQLEQSISLSAISVN